MILPRTEDTALLLVVVLGKAYGRSPTPLSVIAKNHGLSVSFLKKLARHLRKAYVIRSKEGAGGGYVLARPPKEISTWEVIAAVSHAQKSKPKNVDTCPVNAHCLPQTIHQMVMASLKKSLSVLTMEQFL